MNVTQHLLCVAMCFFMGCTNEKIGEPETLSDLQELNNSIYEEMNSYYLWNDEIPSIDPLLESKPADLFDKLLKAEDELSIITDDKSQLYSYAEGLRNNLGYELKFQYVKQGSAQIVAIVKFVHPNSAASNAGLQRGDIISQVNGKTITIDNALELYSTSSIDIVLSKISGFELVDLKSINNIQSYEFRINPILNSSVFTVEGKKVGYLAYSLFLEKYNNDIEQVFDYFNTEGVTELILDLRYCNGGSISAANLLATLIGPKSIQGEVFIEYDYNSTFKKSNNSDDQEFLGELFQTTSSNLNLSRVFVLTTNETASTSEIMIQGLKPYIEVVQLGQVTAGDFYISEIIDLPYNWAIKPIVALPIDASNSFDYNKGLTPDYLIEDGFSYLLGDEKDLMTKAALDLISKGAVDPNIQLNSVQEVNINYRNKNGIALVNF